MIPLLKTPCEECVRQATAALVRAGLRVSSTFDLRSARNTHAECPCPHHGTEACDCQMIVLLVYGSDDQPATLVAHGQDGRTWLSLADGLYERPSSQLEAAIVTALALQGLPR